MVDLLAAPDGILVCPAKEILPKSRGNAALDTEVNAFFILNNRGWVHRYFHMQRIVPSVTVGSRVRKGRKAELRGKQMVLP